MNSAAISKYVEAANQFNERQEKAEAGIRADVEAQAALIKTLQESAGQITPEDQATLDLLQARNEAVTKKLEALDALNPPPVAPIATA